MRHSLAAMLHRGAAGRQRAQLRTAIEARVPGWSTVPVASGRYALQLAIESLGLRGRCLAVPAYVCPAVITASRAAGADVVPIDCAVDSFRFDFVALQRAVKSGRVDAIIATNTYGFDQDFASLRQLGVPIIDDAAYQAGRIDRHGHLCGTRGDAGVWSFNFKALSGLGGGVLLSRQGQDASEVLNSRRSERDVVRWLNYGMRSLMRHHVPKSIAPFRAADAADSVRPAWLTMPSGAMSPLQTAVSLGQWQRRELLWQAEASTRRALIDEIAVSAPFTTIDDDVTAGAHFVPVLVKERGACARDEVARARRSLYADGIQTEAAYPVLLGPPESVPRAIDLAARLFLLPCHAGLEPPQVRHMRTALTRAAGRLLAAAPPLGTTVAENS